MRRISINEALALRAASAGDFSFRGKVTGMRCTAMMRYDGPAHVLARWWVDGKIIYG